MNNSKNNEENIESVEQETSSNSQVNENTENNEETTQLVKPSQSNKQVDNIPWKDFRLVNTGYTNFPSKKWEINNGSLDKNAVQEFNNMLNKCQNITFSNFLLHYQKYANPLLKGRNSHKYHCRHDACKDNGHSKFTNCIGCLEPILYYVVFDWNRLRDTIEKENKDVTS